MPGSRRIFGTVPSGVLGGGAPRAVWSTTESSPHAVSAASAAQRLAQLDQGAHLVWNPLHGEVVQLLPATAAARGALITADHVDRGTEGRVCVVVMVVGFATVPFTNGPLRGLPAIVAWLDSWGVQRRWWAGAPPSPERARGEPGSARLWSLGGHFGHSQVPDTHAESPGRIAPETLLGRAIPRAPAQPAREREETTARPPETRPSPQTDPPDRGGEAGTEWSGIHASAWPASATLARAETDPPSGPAGWDASTTHA